MKKLFHAVRGLLILSLVLAFLPCRMAFGQGCCTGVTGNVNGDPSETVDVGDLVQLIDYLYISHTPLPCYDEANVDGRDVIDIADVKALICYLYYGGTLPACGTALAVDSLGPQSVTVDWVEGRVTASTVAINRPVAFHLRYSNPAPEPYDISNGYRVYSPDGATWSGPVTVDTLTGKIPRSAWTLRFQTQIFDEGAPIDDDTIGITGLSNGFGGLPGQFDDIPYAIRIGSFDAADVGKTICLDSSWFPPSSSWKWVSGCGSFRNPAWGGPYCFTIVEEPVCGDASGNGLIDISDFSLMVGYIYHGGTIPNPAGADMDGYLGVTISDLIYLEDYLFDPCMLGHPTLICNPLQPNEPPELPGNCWDIPERILATGQTEREVTLRLRHSGDLRAYEVPLRILVNGVAAQITDVTLTPEFSYFSSGVYRFSDTSVSILGSSCDLIAGYSDVAKVTISIPAADYCRGLSAGYDLRNPSHKPVLVQTDYTMIRPTEGCQTGCCVNLTGNVDFDLDDLVDISDISYLVDWLFCGQYAPALPCPGEADINSDSSLDIGDLSDLLDYLFDLLPTLQPCP